MAKIDIHQWEFGYILNHFWSNLSHPNGFIKIVQLSPSSILIYLIPFILLISAILFLRLYFRLKKSLKETSILLELTPPAYSEKTAYTTQQLFSTIYSLGKDRNWLDKLIGKKPRFSLEIVSTKHQGIRYLIRCTPDQVSNIKKNLLSFLSQVGIKTVDDYLPKNFEKLENYHSRIIEYKLSRSFAYPLQKQDILNESDPVAYITGMMTKLSPGELVSFQIVLSPTKTKETDIIASKIRGNEDVLGYLNEPEYPFIINSLFSILMVVAKIVSLVGNWIIEVIRELRWGSGDPRSVSNYQYFEMQQQQKLNAPKAVHIPTPYEQETISSIQGKIGQPLFDSSIRLLVIATNKQELKEKTKGFSSSLEPFFVPGYQSLKIKRSILNWLFTMNPLRSFTFKNRLLSIKTPHKGRYAQLLSVSEMADLFHFPFAQVAQTENLVKSYSKELPAPISLKQDIEFDVVFAKNTYGGSTTMIGLTKEQRARHMVVFGGTGNGKTTLILEMMGQDIKNGKGIGFIDPHGDAAEMALLLVPKDREEDVVYIDPDDIDKPFAINLMELNPNLSVNDSLREKERIAESIVSLFRRICSSEFSKAGNNAFRIERILLNTIYTAFTIKDCTLFTIYDLLVDPALLKETVGRLQNVRLQKFWKNEFGRAGDFQVVKMVGGVTARIDRFLNSEAARRILEQPHSTIDFDWIMDNKKILICNLSKGKLSEDISQVLGTTIITKIQLAAMRRAHIPEDKRVPYYLYVDEFQNYATQSFVEMLSEARKYKLNIIIVEQSTSQQQEHNMINTILANAAIVVCFRTGNPEDEKIMLGQYRSFVKEGEIMNLPWFHFFIKIYSKIPQEPFSGETIPVKVHFDKAKIERIINMSREKYGTDYNANKLIQVQQTIKEEKSNRTDNEPKKDTSYRYKAHSKGGLPK